MTDPPALGAANAMQTMRGGVRKPPLPISSNVYHERECLGMTGVTHRADSGPGAGDLAPLPNRCNPAARDGRDIMFLLKEHGIGAVGRYAFEHPPSIGDTMNIPQTARLP